MLTNLQNRGRTANLYPYGFHADLPLTDKEMLTRYSIEHRDDRGPTNRRRLLTLSAQEANWENEGVNQRLEQKPDYNRWPERIVILATNAAETGVTFENCVFVVDTRMVNVVYHDPSTNMLRSRLLYHTQRRPSSLVSVSDWLHRSNGIGCRN